MASRFVLQPAGGSREQARRGGGHPNGTGSGAAGTVRSTPSRASWNGGSPSPRKARKPFIFGIDFGTTHSGVAWTWPGRTRPEDIRTITKWKSPPGRYDNFESPKSPTVIDYKTDPTSWGYGVPLVAEPIRWFKLLLVDEEDLDDHLKDAPQLVQARKTLRALNKTPVEVVADYLTCLWRHVIEAVIKAAGEAYVKSTPFRIMITVPAIWKPYARERMREAANLAGILEHRRCGDTELDFISEPEAAAIATLADFEGRPDIKQNDTITIVDAGGGTVDLISYRIDKVKPLTISEAVEGTGALCGAIFLDQEFEDMMREVITDSLWKQIPPEEIKEMLQRSWEYGIKRQFDGTEGSETTWDVGPPPTYILITKKKKLSISSGHIKEAFDYQASQISDLVDDQVSRLYKKTGRPPKYVILVGGFGRCKYLHSRLKAELEGESTVHQEDGPAPWTAICRGAVLKAAAVDLPVTVQSRISRANYGNRVRRHWEDGQFEERDTYWCEIECMKKVRNQVDWFLKRGENTSEKAPVKMNYYQSYMDSDPEDYPIIRFGLLTCDDYDPPARVEPNVRDLCEITFVSAMPFEDLPWYVNKNGQVVRELNYTCLFSCNGASVDIILEAKGQRMGSKNLAISFESSQRPPRPPGNLRGPGTDHQWSPAVLINSMEKLNLPPAAPLPKVSEESGDENRPPGGHDKNRRVEYLSPQPGERHALPSRTGSVLPPAKHDRVLGDREEAGPARALRPSASLYSLPRLLSPHPEDCGDD